MLRHYTEYLTVNLGCRLVYTQPPLKGVITGRRRRESVGTTSRNTEGGGRSPTIFKAVELQELFKSENVWLFIYDY